MIVLCIVLLALSALMPVSYAASSSSIDLLLIRDVICAKESEGEPNRDWAFNGYTDVGRCQVHWDTAYSIGGFERNRSPGDLFQRDTNERVALNIIARCYMRWKHPTPYLVGYCYHAGLHRRMIAGSVWDLYGKDIAKRYKDKMVAER